MVFQACLAAGLPRGPASMGGRFPGTYPPKMRIVALVNILILAVSAIIVLIKAGFLWTRVKPISDYAIWGVVIFALISTILNTITPSKIERIWAPVAAVLLVTSSFVALN